MSAVEKYCDRAVLVEGGKVVFEGEASDTARHYLDLFDTKQVPSEGSSTTKELTILNPQCTVTERHITVEIDVHAHTAVNDFIVDIDFYHDGKLVAGMGSVDKKAFSQSLEEGRTDHLSFAFQNILSRNEFTIDIGLRTYDGKHRYAYSRRALRFRNDETKVSKKIPVVIPVKLTKS